MITNQEQLKDLLDSLDLKIYDRFIKHDYNFLVFYFDNKSNTVVFKDIVRTPEQSIRKFPEISKQTKLPVSDFDIVLVGCYIADEDKYISINTDLDYHIYFTDEEKNENDSKE